MANAQEDCRNCEHWLYRTKLNTKDVAAATHLSLRGGMFSVRNQTDTMQLYNMMARDIRGNVPFFLCEKRSDPGGNKWQSPPQLNSIAARSPN